jgi:hypothetical protein
MNPKLSRLSKVIVINAFVFHLILMLYAPFTHTDAGRGSMAEEKELKSLEMRVAAIEDKLAKTQITEEEMRTYHKVAAAMGMTPGAGVPAAPQLSPQFCVISRSRIVFCWRGPIVPTAECTCGPCDPQAGAGGGGFAGGFGGFGT